MAVWKKVIVSGSNAELNTLSVSNSITSSIFSGSAFTGSLFGTASWARNALTASYGNITGSLFGTSSWATRALTASFLPVGTYNITSSWATNAISSSRPIAVTGSTIYSTAPLSTATPSTDNNIFLGDSAGNNASGSSNSNFLGYGAGLNATNAISSNFLGRGAGLNATNAGSSNFLGYGAGSDATEANSSNFLGLNAGTTATNAYFSNFLGVSAGEGATDAYESNFLGPYAGYEALNANNSNFLGGAAGAGATNANASNFLGPFAGDAATDAYDSNFIGLSAGASATNANNSNFLGKNAGLDAVNANSSNFLGNNAGSDATEANSSNFLGPNAGNGAVSASYSTLIGYQAGYTPTAGTSVKSNNIIIGTNITLPTNTQDSINLGAIIFATGSYSTLAGNPFSGSMSNGRVGINKVTPSYTLDVSGSGNYTNGLIVTGSLTVITGSSIELQVTNTGVTIGNVVTDIHRVTGSLNVSGSTNLNGNLIVSGNTTIGDATTDSITMNAATMSLGSGTGILNIDSNTFTVDGNANSVGIGTSTPTSRLHLIGGTLVQNTNNYGLHVTATMPTSYTYLPIGAFFDITSAGTQTNASYPQRAFQVSLNAGYTGGTTTAAIVGANSAAGTDSGIVVGGTPLGNAGLIYTAVGNTTGNNYGCAGFARLGNISIGVVGRVGHTTSVNNKNGAKYVGVFGVARNDTAANSVSLGGYFGLNTSDPTFANAALIADNADAAYDIFVARDNGTPVFTIQDGGSTIIANSITATGSIVTGSSTVIGTSIISGSLTFAPSSSISPFNGEIVRFGSGTLTTGQLYFLSSSGTWSLANANSTGSSTGMLGIATGTSPTTNGLLIRGFAYSGSYTTATGSIVYAATSSGLMTTASPSSSNHVVRVVGYVTTVPNTIYFDPDKTWVTLA